MLDDCAYDDMIDEIDYEGLIDIAIEDVFCGWDKYRIDNQSEEFMIIVGIELSKILYLDLTGNLDAPL